MSISQYIIRFILCTASLKFSKNFNFVLLGIEVAAQQPHNRFDESDQLQSFKVMIFLKQG